MLENEWVVTMEAQCQLGLRFCAWLPTLPPHWQRQSYELQLLQALSPLKILVWTHVCSPNLPPFSPAVIAHRWVWLEPGKQTHHLGLQLALGQTSTQNGIAFLSFPSLSDTAPPAQAEVQPSWFEVPHLTPAFFLFAAMRQELWCNKQESVAIPMEKTGTR